MANMSTAPTPATLLGGISIETFLAKYWQKKPLLIRQALPEFESPLTPDELAGLACEDIANGRIIKEKDGSKPWEVSNGPFNETDFANLPETHYTLLVTDCEKLIPDLQSMLDHFSFIPDWRVDDLMISYAAEHGSVGPHVDQYDVFLLQGMGKRHWKISEQDTTKTARISDCDLDLLAEWQTSEEWTLEPGDMLYLPPGIAHHGTAVGDNCMTYSVGFRAPAHQEIVQEFFEDIMSNKAVDEFYTDPHLKAQSNRGAISTTAVTDFQRIIQENANLPLESLSAWMGQFLTETKTPDLLHVPEEVISPEMLDHVLKKPLQRDTASQIAFHVTSQNIQFFYNGQLSILPLSSLNYSEYLCERHQYESKQLVAFCTNTNNRKLLCDLLNDGCLFAS